MLNSLQGLLFIGLGLVLLVVAAGEFLLRIFIVVISLALINYGLRLRGEPPLTIYISQIRRIFWF